MNAMSLIWLIVAIQVLLVAIAFWSLWRVEKLTTRAASREQERVQVERDALYKATDLAAETLEIIAAELLWTNIRQAQGVAQAAKSLRELLKTVGEQ